MNFILQDEQKELDEITAKRQKKGRNEEEAPGEEKTILHGTYWDFEWFFVKGLTDLFWVSIIHMFFLFRLKRHSKNVVHFVLKSDYKSSHLLIISHHLAADEVCPVDKELKRIEFLILRVFKEFCLCPVRLHN